ncbi:hypothetical protein B0T17DRAFT_615146 [Bombardia bombarda]|uniref:Uncharacterized protein n=1 Tax=Bombardia bombarda TaxID=252184 RepID=A0AA40C8Y0_9PEZI|nr:hypothetical protein B0T17DRAFT_615146 [Bombardia bombarda]
MYKAGDVQKKLGELESDRFMEFEVDPDFDAETMNEKGNNIPNQSSTKVARKPSQGYRPLPVVSLARSDSTEDIGKKDETPIKKEVIGPAIPENRSWAAPFRFLDSDDVFRAYGQREGIHFEPYFLGTRSVLRGMKALEFKQFTAVTQKATNGLDWFPDLSLEAVNTIAAAVNKIVLAETNQLIDAGLSFELLNRLNFQPTGTVDKTVAGLVPKAFTYDGSQNGREISPAALAEEFAKKYRHGGPRAMLVNAGNINPQFEVNLKFGDKTLKLEAKPRQALNQYFTWKTIQAALWINQSFAKKYAESVKSTDTTWYHIRHEFYEAGDDRKAAAFSAARYNFLSKIYYLP